MADLSITAANVLASGSAITVRGVAGATIARGQAVYLDSADSKYKLADTNSATAAVRNVVGIALCDAANNQPIVICTEDADFTPGATLTAGERYYLSATAGGIMPSGDLASGDYPAFLFVATSATKAVFKIVKGTAAIPI